MRLLMANMTGTFLLCVALVFHLSGNAQYYLEHINIIDIENGNISKDQSVCIDKKSIKSISAGPIENPKGPVYDCSGKYLIPGLWDMHIHDAGDDSSNRYEYIPLFLVNGVTGIRDMWGSPEMLKLKNDIDAGRFTGPRMVIGSPIIDGGKPFFAHSLAAATEIQGRHYVDSLSDAGYDFIKIYSLVREPVYLAIADECRKRGIALEGHLSIEIGLEEALDAGQRSFEHNFNINRYLTGKEAELVKWSHHYLDTVHSTKDPEFMVHNEPLGVSAKDFYLPPAVLNKMIKNRVAIVPTLTLAQGRSENSGLMAKRTRGLEYLTPEFVNYWIHQAPAFPTEFEQTFGAAAKFLMDKGVLILAGTDVNNPFCVPGFGLQQELVNLRHAGLTNLQVLQTATINPARFLYRENELGTVTAGKLADLLILDDNPLVDISNTQKINAVIVNGRYFSKNDLKEMLEAQRKK
jgi:imidazolonepropionase-like amidohydrolase